MYRIVKRVRGRLHRFSHRWFLIEERTRHLLIVLGTVVIATMMTMVGEFTHTLIDKDHGFSIIILWWVVWFVVIGLILFLFAISIDDNKKLLDQNALLLDKEEELRKKNSELEVQAHKDYLTGLYSRRFLIEEAGERLISSANRHGEYVCMCFIDLNDFKKINDAYGHDAGDAALKLVASMLNNKMRTADIICRWGGDEFIVVWATKDIEEADKILDRLDKALNNITLFYKVGSRETQEIQFSATVGFHYCPTDQKNETPSEILDKLIKKTDEVMLGMKKYKS